MRHFFETVFYYCYLSYKKNNPDPEIMALSALSAVTSLFFVIAILTICIYYNINLAETVPLFCLSLFPFPLLYFIFYRMLYAKGKYKEIIEKKPKFCDNPEINKRIALGYIWGILILTILLIITWGTLKKLN